MELENVKWQKIKQAVLTGWITLISVIIPKVAFARMGSTGGGHAGGGGHVSLSTGGSHGYTSSGSGGDAFSWSSLRKMSLADWLSQLMILFVMAMVYVWYFFYDAVTAKYDCRGLDLTYQDRWLLTPNMTVSRFKSWFDDFESSTTGIYHEQALIDLYGQAEFAYGDAIRRLFTGQGDYLGQLDKYLGRRFLHTMAKEIKLKASKATIDDVIVTNGQIVDYKFVQPNVIVAKVKVRGVDNEVDVAHGFDNSFSQQEWEDFVVFGRAYGTWRIFNIIYGEHFHLAGEDFNHEQSLLDGAKYIEQRIQTKVTLDMARHYQRETTWQQLSNLVLKIAGFLLLAGVATGNLDTGWPKSVDVIVMSIFEFSTLIAFIYTYYLRRRYAG